MTIFSSKVSNNPDALDRIENEKLKGIILSVTSYWSNCGELTPKRRGIRPPPDLCFPMVFFNQKWTRWQFEWIVEELPEKIHTNYLIQFSSEHSVENINLLFDILPKYFTAKSILYTLCVSIVPDILYPKLVRLVFDKISMQEFFETVSAAADTLWPRVDLEKLQNLYFEFKYHCDI